jgi:hypothetical protein
VVLFWSRRGEVVGPRLNWKRALIGAAFVAAILILIR